MEYEDTITISTPEGIEVEYTLAGVGSRFIAELIDILLRVALLLALAGIFKAVGEGTAAAVTLIVATFLAWFAYDVVFEVWGGGRTLGKRWSGLRVTMAVGEPVTLGPSAARTLLRLLDQWLSVGIIGMICIAATRHNQRLGDLAGGTIVVRERHPAISGSFELDRSVPAGVDVTAVTSSELAAVRDFLARRDGLSAEARRRVAHALADALRTKVGGMDSDGAEPEWLLEIVAAAKRGPDGAPS